MLGVSYGFHYYSHFWLKDLNLHLLLKWRVIWCRNINVLSIPIYAWLYKCKIMVYPISMKIFITYHVNAICKQCGDIWQTMMMWHWKCQIRYAALWMPKIHRCAFLFILLSNSAATQNNYIQQPIFLNKKHNFCSEVV